MFKKVFLILVVCLVVFVGNAVAVDPVIEGVTATAWHTLFEQAPPHVAVDGSGLDANGLYHTNWYEDTWVGDANIEPGNPNPGTVSGPAWIRFDLGQIYGVSESWIWNSNDGGGKNIGDEGNTVPGPNWVEFYDRGLKDVTIEYSLTGGSDSSEWLTFGDTQIPKASGYGWNIKGIYGSIDANNPFYDPMEDDGAAGPNFGGIQAKYLVITAKAVDGNWGYGVVGHIDFPNARYGLAEVRFHGTSPWATEPDPADTQENIEPDGADQVLVSWRPGSAAASHDVYFGTDETEVAGAARGSVPAGVTLEQAHPDPCYPIPAVEAGEWYYWRVDEVNVAGTPEWFGQVWSFRVTGNLVFFEDFELGGEGVSVTDLIKWEGEEEIKMSSETILTNMAIDGNKTFDGNTMYVVYAGITPPPADYSGYITFTAEMVAGPNTENAGIGLTKEEGFGIGLWYEGISFGWFIDMRTLVDDPDMELYYLKLTDINDANGPIAIDEVVTGTITINLVDKIVTASVTYNGGADTNSLTVVLPSDARTDLLDTVFVAQDVRVPRKGFDVDNILITQETFKIAKRPSPANNATNVSILSTAFNVLLTWGPAPDASAHDVYFGTSYEDVNNVTRDTNETMLYYSEAQAPNDFTVYVDLATTYYWRVDEVNAAGEPQWKGNIWQFSMAENIVPLILPSAITPSTPPSTLWSGDPWNVVNGAGLDPTGRYHDNNPDHMWGGWTFYSPSSAYPGTVSGPLWLALEFDEVYDFDEMEVWNYSAYDPSGDGTIYGFKDVTIQYSQDAVSWDTVGGGVTQFNQAPSEDGWNKYLSTGGLNPNYNPEAGARNTVVDMGAGKGKYVVLTLGAFNNNWGGSFAAGLAELRFYFPVPFASLPIPDRDTDDQPIDIVLSWKPGTDAVTHKVYFGTAKDDLSLVATLPVGTDYYDPCDPADDSALLEWNTTYHWRVDQVNTSAVTVKGLPWFFRTMAGLIVDNMEEIELSWQVSANGTAAIEAIDANFIIGSQSMVFDYNNGDPCMYSEVSAPTGLLDVGSDWTQLGVKMLGLQFYGDPCNADESLYIGLDSGSGVKVKTCSDDLVIAGWTQWYVPLSYFTALGVDLNSVEDVYIGVGNRAFPSAGGAGKLYIDEIRLYPPLCTPEMDNHLADIAGQNGLDCYVDEWDLKAMGDAWLKVTRFGQLEAKYTFEDNLPTNTAPSGFAPDGTLVSNASIVDVGGDRGKVLYITDANDGSLLDAGGEGADSWADVRTYTVAFFITDVNYEGWTEPAEKFIEADRPNNNGGWLFELLNKGASGTDVYFVPYYGTTSETALGLIPTGQPINDGFWHHIAGTCSFVPGAAEDTYDTEWALYIDGSLVDSNSLTGENIADIYDSNGGVHFGGGEKYPGDSLRCKMDDIRFYSAVLNAGQISDLNSGIEPDVTGILIYGPEADIYVDGIVDFRDFAILADEWTQDPIYWP